MAEEKIRRIVNLTQHKVTAEQVEGGVFDLDEKTHKDLETLLTFEVLPTREEIERRAEAISELAIEAEVDGAMIGGAPYLMSTLERALIRKGINPLYAFSLRVSEEKEVEGKIIKTQVFKHMGFVGVA